MNKTERLLLERAAADDAGIVPVDRHAFAGREHRAATYLHAENYGIYFANEAAPHFRLHADVKQRLKR